jgi:hypothetical protein
MELNGEAWTLDASGLTDGEELILWATRSLVAARATWPEVKGELRRRLGLIAGEAAAHALARFLDTLGRDARRDLYLHQPHCYCVGTTELGLLNLIAASAQDPARAETLVRFLVPGPVAAELLDHARVLAQALAVGGMALEPRFAEAEMPAMSVAPADGPRLTLVATPQG